MRFQRWACMIPNVVFVINFKASQSLTANMFTLYEGEAEAKRSDDEFKQMKFH